MHEGYHAVYYGEKQMQHFAGLTEEALEAMAEQYREPPPPQAAPDLAGDEWPDLGAPQMASTV